MIRLPQLYRCHREPRVREDESPPSEIGCHARGTLSTALPYSALPAPHPHGAMQNRHSSEGKEPEAKEVEEGACYDSYDVGDVSGDDRRRLRCGVGEKEGREALASG